MLQPPLAVGQPAAGARRHRFTTSDHATFMTQTSLSPANRPAIAWRPWPCHLPATVPAELRPWLLDSGSLTRHLRALSDQRLQVERLAQAWRLPQPSEARWLNLAPGRRALVREVILRGNGTPWVYARSIIPPGALHGDLRRLRWLKEAPLGEVLFRQPHLRRTPFELARLEPRQLPPVVRAAIGRATYLWGRRSRFAVGERQLIVSEIFLPAFRPGGRPGAR